MTPRLLRLRLALGLTQSQCAARCGCSIPTWRAWESIDDNDNDAPRPSPKHTNRLLPGLQVQGWLLEGKLEQGRVLTWALCKEDSDELARLEAYLLPEVGREVLAVWPNDLEEWYRVTGIETVGRDLVYRFDEQMVGGGLVSASRIWADKVRGVR